MSTESTSPLAVNGGGPRRPGALGARVETDHRDLCPAPPRLGRALTAGLLFCGLAACGAPEPIWPALEATDVQVFFPVSGHEGSDEAPTKATAVRVRNDALPAEANLLQVRVLPAGQRYIFLVLRPGDYTDLQLPAEAGAILELSALGGGRQGAPIYVQVPTGPSDTPLACVGGHCAGLANTVCSVDSDCSRYQGEAVAIPASGLHIGWLPPTQVDPARAYLDVPTEPGMLVWVQNRHRVAHGQTQPPPGNPRLRIATSTTTRFTLFDARAGDHIWFRLYRASRQYSPLGEQTVPQAKLTGISVLGVQIEDDEGPTFFISLDGDDHRGFCPVTDRTPPLCLGGGPSAADFSARVPPASASSEPTVVLATALGTQGDVREGPVETVVVFDVGESVQALDPEQHRIPEVISALRPSLRSFDRLTAISFGPTGTKSHPNFSFKGLERHPKGEGRLTDALLLAFKRKQATRKLRIVAIVASNQGEISAELQAELRDVQVHILDVGAPAYTRAPGTIDLDEIAVLSDGLVWPTQPFNKLSTMIDRVRNRLVGGFLVHFPKGVPADAMITAEIGDQALHARFEGESP